MNLTVDPMEKMDTCFRQKTHFWKTFVSRGLNKLIVTVQNKNEEDIIVSPDFFGSTFKEIGVCSGSFITLHDLKNVNLDFDEEGEAEQEDMEDEQEEEPAAKEEEEEDEDKKASEVLLKEQPAAK